MPRSFPLSPVGFAASAVVLVLVHALPARAACPVGQIVTVDNDKPGSGYSEDNPKDWEEHNVDACEGTYRYLTRGTAPTQPPGKAFWKPAIKVAGVYEVETGFRASSNRSDDADYVLTGDLGDSAKLTVDQTLPMPQSACKRATVGKVRCLPDGKCQLTLIGKGGESVASDVTTFKLVECIDVTPPDKPPTGNLDQADCNGLSGWAWDPDEPTLAIEAHLYLGGPAGSGAFGVPLTANVTRPDLCTAIGSCAHGFLAPFPDNLRDDVARPVHAYGVNTKTNTSGELPGSPKTAQCGPKPVDPPPVGGTGGASGSSAGGASGSATSGGTGGTSSGGNTGLGGTSAAAGTSATGGAGFAGKTGGGSGGKDSTGSGGNVTGAKGGAGGARAGAAGDAGGSDRPRSGASDAPSSNEGGCTATSSTDRPSAALVLLGLSVAAWSSRRRFRA